MSDTMAPPPKGDPIFAAWEKYQATDDYANTRRWAQHEKHVDGSLWAAFLAGFKAGETLGERHAPTTTAPAAPPVEAEEESGQ